MVKENRIKADSEAVTNVHGFLWRQSHEVIHELYVWLKLHKQTGSLGSDWLKLPSITGHLRHCAARMYPIGPELSPRPPTRL